MHATRPICSAPVSPNDGLDCRAVGVLVGEEIVWFWTGHHEEYDRLLRGL